MPIEELQLSVRTYHCLKRAGIDTVEQLSRMTDEELMKLRNFGIGCLNEVRAKIGAPRKTNADVIRDLSDEHLANYLIQFTDLDCRIGFCQNLPKCDALLETEDGIPASMCEKCLLEWLQKPAEAKNINNASI